MNIPNKTPPFHRQFVSFGNDHSKNVYRTFGDFVEERSCSKILVDHCCLKNYVNSDQSDIPWFEVDNISGVQPHLFIYEELSMHTCQNMGVKQNVKYAS